MPASKESAEKVAIGIAQDFPLLNRLRVASASTIVFVSFVEIELDLIDFLLIGRIWSGCFAHQSEGLRFCAGRFLISDLIISRNETACRCQCKIKRDETPRGIE